MAFLTKSSDSKSGLANRVDNQLTTLPLQAKLRMGRPNDTFEQEADRIADRVVNASGLDSVQRQMEDEEPIQTKPVAGDISRFVQKQTEDEEEPVQAQMEDEEEPVQAQMEDEEEPVQAQMEDEEEPVQAQMEDEEEPVQAQMEDEEEPVQAQMEDEEESVRARALSGTELQDPGIEQKLMATKGSGLPLEPEVRRDMEATFGHDLSAVRIHTGTAAIELNKLLGAQAFTHGNDVYFNLGKYDPASTEGQRLLAHELVHVVQQSGTVERKMIQRADGVGTTDSGTLPPTEFSLSDGTRIERTQRTYPGSDVPRKRIQLPEISLPSFKVRNERRFPSVLALRPSRRGDTQQNDLWQESVRANVSRHLNPMIEAAQASGGYIEEDNVYFFRALRNPDFFLFGTPEQLLESAMLPFWDDRGNPNTFQIDHVVEDQLVNANDASLSGLTTADRASNFELLDATANQSSGSRLNSEIDRRLRAAVTLFATEHPAERPLTFRGLRRGYYVNFLRRDFDLQGTGGEPNKFWSHRQILQGNHLQVLKPIPGRELSRLNREARPVIFTSAQGGKREFVPPEAQLPRENWLPRVDLKEVHIHDNPSQSHPAGWIIVDAYRASEARGGSIHSSFSNMRWNLKPIPGVYGGAIDKEYLVQNYLDARMSLQLPGLSPIRIDRLDVTAQGIQAEGKVLPTIPLIGDADIDLIIDGRSIRLRKIFDLSEIHIPAPFEVTSASLEFSYGTQGLGASGEVNFVIQSIGEGRVVASFSTRGGFELEGEFNFDSKLFNPAKITVTYREKQLGVGGEIGIPPGKVRGIKRATIAAVYADNEFTADGEAELDVPGVERGTLSVAYNPAGWSIGGTFQLKNDIPGIRSGSVSATVQKVAGEEGYRLTARGTAVPDIPGITSQLTVEYDNGALKIEGRASYNRDLLSGEINVGATNRALDDAGQPTGDPTDHFIMYGGGSLTIRITPWLQGTVGVQFLPNGEIKVAGRIGLPSSIDVFPKIGIPERELFGVGFDIPIFAIPVGPKSIGLKASIRGGLRAFAFIGPGRLEQLELGVEYNPEHVEETRVKGAGRFVVPAEAGLKLTVRATVGLNAVIGGVEGGLEVAGGLGLEAAAEAAFNVDWTPTTGLELNAQMSAHVQPKFIFTIDGVIEAWFAWYDKEWRWRLADYEYGSNMRFGVRLPIHYREGEPFDISFDDLQIERPDIDVRSMLGGLIRDIRNQRS